jgi:hypothetical protein
LTKINPLKQKRLTFKGNITNRRSISFKRQAEESACKNRPLTVIIMDPGPATSPAWGAKANSARRRNPTPAAEPERPDVN